MKTEICEKIKCKVTDEGSVKRAAKMLKQLQSSELISQNAFRLLKGHFFKSIEVNDVNHSTIGTGVIFGISVEEDYFKLLAALLAADSLFNRKIKAHKGDVSGLQKL